MYYINGFLSDVAGNSTVAPKYAEMHVYCIISIMVSVYSP